MTEHSTRSALVVGIDRYPRAVFDSPPGSVADVRHLTSLLESGRLPLAHRFDCQLLTPSDRLVVTAERIRCLASTAFSKTSDVLLFHFAGHVRSARDGSRQELLFIGQDGRGLSLSLLLKLVDLSGWGQRIITLDCGVINGCSSEVTAHLAQRQLPDRCTLLALASESAWVESSKGLTSHLIDAFQGRAANDDDQVTTDTLQSYLVGLVHTTPELLARRARAARSVVLSCGGSLPGETAEQHACEREAMQTGDSS